MDTAFKTIFDSAGPIPGDLPLINIFRFKQDFYYFLTNYKKTGIHTIKYE